MNFKDYVDFDKLSELAQTNPEAFERERTRLINEYINSLPKDRIEKAREFQKGLDEKRKTMSSEDFMNVCIGMMTGNQAEIACLTQELIQTIDTATKPAATQPTATILEFKKLH